MEQFCNECIHCKVCKYVDDFSAKTSIQLAEEKDSIFKTTITCKYYKKSEPTVKEVDPLYTTVIKNFGTTRNCESCS